MAAPNFGVMASEGLLKENIDGEALLWASSRLNDQPAKKKILFVFSDGAPVDDSTLSVNPGTYLENHLKAVIPELSKRSGRAPRLATKSAMVLSRRKGALAA